MEWILQKIMAARDTMTFLMRKHTGKASQIKLHIRF